VKRIILGDNLDVLPKLPDGFASLIYFDSPFNTQKPQKRDRIKVREAVEGEEHDRIGFGGKKYITEHIENSNIYNDSFDNFEEFLMPRIKASLHCLTKNGSIMIHLDQRESHYIKCAMDRYFGDRRHCINELIWHWDFGAKSKTRWSNKSNSIFWYAMNPDDYIFNYDAIDRIPYMSDGGLVPEEKLKIGKIPTNVWWFSIVGTNSKEKQAGNSYPTQKPVKLLDRIIKVHSRPGDTIIDFFAGSGTTGQAAENNGRQFVMIDSNPDACAIMKARLPAAECVGF
jgi:site-specific DNA-methyltransferase (adenine-specific)